MVFKIIKTFQILFVATALFAEMNPARSLGKSSNPVLVSNETTRSDKIVLKYRLPEPEFSAAPFQEIDGKQTVRMHISNCPYFRDPGKPEIPRIPVRAILPYGKTVDRVDVLNGDEKIISIDAHLSWGEMDQPISIRTRVETSPESSIYRTNTVYPAKNYGELEIQKAFGISIAKLDLYPVNFSPQAKTISFFKDLTLVIHLKSEIPSGDMRIDVDRFRERGNPTEENYEALETYPSGSVRGDTYDYILITSESIANNNSVSPNVNDLIELRKSQGLTTKVVTVEEIENEYSGANKGVKIRNFIKHAYNTWNTKFVTLGGDVNVVSNLNVTIWYGWDRIIASDMPFQCLDGETWGGDYEAEIYVGRLAGENAEEISNQLHKIIVYETDPADSYYLKRSLGVGSNLDYQNWGMAAIEHLYNTIYPTSWQHDSLYEKVSDWGQEDFINALATNKYGDINHDGHATENGTMSFGVGETDRLINTKYPFAYSLSCLAGKFTVDCIAEQLISEHKIGGFFGGVLNSDVGLYSQNNSLEGGSPEMQRSFWEGYWEQKLDYLSQCNAYSHQMTNGEMSQRFSCATTNYFGDAATRFRGRDLETSIDQKKNLINNSVKQSIYGVYASSNKLSFKLQRDSKLSVNIYSLNGRLVYSISLKNYKQGVNVIKFKRGEISKGIYLVKFKTEKKQIFTKVSL